MIAQLVLVAARAGSWRSARALLCCALMPDIADARRLIRKEELEACACVTRTRCNNNPDATQRRYEGMLMCEVRVGVPLVLALADRRRLVTSTIRRVEPVSANLVHVETTNSRYSIRRLVARG